MPLITHRAGSGARHWTNLPAAGLLLLLAVPRAEGATRVFYSVGTSRATLTDLKIGSPTLTIAAGVATFSVDQAVNVGVGDEISYGAGPTLVYISGRLSSLQYTVTDRLGAPAANVAGATVNRIYRAFASLTLAEANSTNGTHLGTANLVVGDFELNWPCYDDGPMVLGAGAEVVISGYNTGATNFVRVYTPVTASEVGVSQRHRGVFGSGFRLEGTNADTIQIEDDYVRIEGLTIQATVTAPGAWGGIWSIPNGASDIRISHNIVRGVVTAGNPAYGIALGQSAADVARVSNNIVFNVTNSGGAAYGIGITIDFGFSYVFNNTIYNCETGIRKWPSAAGAEVRNNVAIHDVVTNPGYVDYDQLAAAPAAVQGNNVSSDATAAGAGSVTGQTAYAAYFANTVPGTEDLHLRATSLVLWGVNGADLSGNPNLPVTNDIDKDARTRPDIGADEAGGSMRVKSGTYVGNGTSQAILGVGFRPDLLIVSADSTNAGVNGSSGHTDVLRTSTMAGNVSKAAYIYSAAPLVDRITSLDLDGFSVGHPPNHLLPNDNPGDPYHCVNHSGVRYYWVAFEAAPGEMAVGTYTGNGAATQDVTTVGFQPDYTLVLPSDGEDPIQRFRLMPANYSFDFDGGSQCPALCSRSPESGLRTELASGFQVGQYVNNNAIVYHYVAWKETAGRIKVGTYTGDGNDNVSITGTGFRPEMVQVVNGLTPVPNSSTTYKPASTGASSDYSLVYIAYTNAYQGPDAIQALTADGFEIGQDNNLNDPGDPHYWIAFGPGLDVPTPTHYRSIGTAADLVNQGTITVTAGSTRVTKTGGTGFRAANRGRGDRFTVGAAHYQILAVNSDDQLTLASPAVVRYTGGTYTIARQFGTLASWYQCISNQVACAYFDAPTASLVADNRREVGIAYDETAFTLVATVDLSAATTDPDHDIVLTADPGNRHSGTAGTGVVVNPPAGAAAFLVRDNEVTIEWLEIAGGGRGVDIQSPFSGLGHLGLRNNLIHNTTQDAVRFIGGNDARIHNNFIYLGGADGIDLGGFSSKAEIDNNTIYGVTLTGITGCTNPDATLRNNIVAGNTGGQIGCTGRDPDSSNNLASNGSGTTNSPAGGGIDNVTPTDNPTICGTTCVGFTSLAPIGTNLHLAATTYTNQAVGNAATLSSLFTSDIDAGVRAVPWDIGADELGATTEVALLAFSASAADSAVDLSWETGSELRNLGFHVYRSREAGGPWERITSALIPGLGSSPTGARYRYRDRGLSNGTTYYYLLEDVETTGRKERHGPVFATPEVGAGGGGDGDAGSGDGTGGGTGDEPGPGEGGGGGGRITYGDPGKTSLRELERGPSHVVLELVTPGFAANQQADGLLRIEIPGFEDSASPGALAVPLRRALVEAVAGRGVRLGEATAEDVVSFDGLRLAAAGSRDVEVGVDGTVRAVSSPRRLEEKNRRAGLFPRRWARVAGSLFQGETKKAQLELSPLRHDPQTGRTVLARRLTVRVEFVGVESAERSLGGARGRRARMEARTPRGVVAQLAVHDPGLYVVRFEDVLAGKRAVSARSLRLSRLGQGVAYHIVPDQAQFGPGSRLFFLSEGSDLNPRADAVYELELGRSALRMEVRSGAPTGASTTEYIKTLRLEQNRFYQAALLGAPDLWLWDLLVSPVTRACSFTLDALSSSSTASRLKVVLQGASDFPGVADHHLRVSLNGIPVGEVSFDGKTEQVVEALVSPGVLVEGSNTLSLENVGDAGAAYSMVFLNRFEVSYPRLPVAENGSLRGRLDQGGQIEIAGLSGASVVVEDNASPVWLQGMAATPGGLSFRGEAGQSYLAVAEAALKVPQVKTPPSRRLRARSHRARWVLIAPREFLPAAAPLVDLRRRQGLGVMAVALEDVYSEFGFGEAGPEAIRDFLSYAFHNWKTSPRYVVLLGDSTYDPKDYLGTHVKDRVPSPLLETSFLWTVSDPSLAAVNGEDLVPDLALGRLSAGSYAEAERLVEKLVAFEEAGRNLGGKAVLVADNADLAGSFEANQDEIVQTILAGREVDRVYLRDLGAATRTTIKAALDGGPGLLSYAGHGSTAVWASENVWNNSDLASLDPQPRQPLLLTLNCLNGFFHFPPFDSLAEAFVKAEGRGAIAAFSPSGLSIDAAAHLYQQALLTQIESRGHQRIGDALLAAQSAYADQGALPELLSIYHLFGDPAMRIQ